MHNFYYEKIGNKVTNINDEIPFDIPDNWTWARIKTVCEIRNGFTPRRDNDDFWNNGTIPWFTIEDKHNQGMFINYTEQHITGLALTKNRIVPANSVLLCCTASIGEVSYTNIPITTNQQFNGLSIKNEYFNILNSHFLLLFSRTLKRLLNNELATSTTFGFVSVSRIGSLLIPIAPMNEQLTISKLIEKIDIMLSNIDMSYKNIKEYISCAKKKILDDVFGENSSYKSYYEKEYTLGELLEYEQPGPYIVKSTKYNDLYKTPVLTPGKSFILGYTDENNGIYKVEGKKVIIFDDFTTASRIIDFDFKVKSSAMKILSNTGKTQFDIEYLYYLLQTIHIDNDTHKRYWISEYAPLKVKIHTLDEQLKIVKTIKTLYNKFESINNV